MKNRHSEYFKTNYAKKNFFFKKGGFLTKNSVDSIAEFVQKFLWSVIETLTMVSKTQSSTKQILKFAPALYEQRRIMYIMYSLLFVRYAHTNETIHNIT